MVSPCTLGVQSVPQEPPHRFFVMGVAELIEPIEQPSRQIEDTLFTANNCHVFALQPNHFLNGNCSKANESFASAFYTTRRTPSITAKQKHEFLERLTSRMDTSNHLKMKQHIL